MLIEEKSLMRESIRLLGGFWRVALLATCMGAVAGLATAMLLGTINRALHQLDTAATSLILAIAGLCALTIAGEIISDLGNSYVGQQVVARLRTELSEKILAAPIYQIELYRLHRLTVTLNQDVETISGFTFAFSSLAIAFAVTLGGFIYLVTLSPLMSVMVAAAIAIGSWIHAIARRTGRRGFDAAREAQDDLQKHYRAITEGAKELRINRARRHRVQHLHLFRTIGRIRDLRIRAMRIFMSANAFGSALFFIVIAAVLALRGSSGLPSEAMSGFVIVLLYIKGPLQQLVAALPMLGQAQVAFQRVAELSAAFANPEKGVIRAPAGTALTFHREIALQDISYAFADGGGVKPFVLGPIDLTIDAGEMVFIVGENGCGKTTLIKLLLGLYEPLCGAIRLDGLPIDEQNRDDYRQLFTTVFSDYYLFDELLYDGIDADAARPYLERLEIAHKVTVKDGRFTTTDLSTGQRKRLALVHAYLEDRPVIVFDEWAADQDPTFRRIFYTELLPELKRRGKTLIVISHDDRYFEIADRVIHMADGNIRDIRPARQIADVR